MEAMEAIMATDDITTYRKRAKITWKLRQAKKAKSSKGYFGGWFGGGAAADDDAEDTTEEDYNAIKAMALEED